ncbi:fibrinogen-like protein A [Mizuhopecten yessoensis]|uniref:fibrinogen-like protein A n=1 Tax=Mizuhopecten yessoensis TaxID=6573 RepID=UPI000B4581B4|nr:fibrinogen-like protein A [Mizuhopecten yessoensis]
MNSATITNNKYSEVTKTIEQNHAGSVLSTSSWNSKLGCASSCDTSTCISFSFNSVTKECKTYGEEICYRDDGVGSSSLRFYTKVVLFDCFENLRLLLAQDMELRIELQGWSGSVKHVEYHTFYVSDEASEYRLTIGGFSTPDDLFDALADHNDWRFSTFDNDNDDLDGGKCTSNAHGAWWYGACYDSNLFGTYSSNNGYASMVWKYLYGSGEEEYTAVKTVRMMVKKA